MFITTRLRVGLMMFLLTAILTASGSVTLQAQNPPENIDSIRKEFADLAPFLSMDGLVSLETLDVNKTTQKLGRIEDYSKRQFHAHPILEKVGRHQMQLLIKREQRIVPVYEPQDLTFEDIVLGGISEINAQNVLRQWRLDDDEQDRQSYEAVMPIVRMLTGPAEEGNQQQVTLRANQDELVVRHRFPARLTNVTFVASFSGIPSQKCTAYYFCDEWMPGTDFALRIPYERSHFGVSGVLAIDIEVYSDEHTVPRLHTDFPDHVPLAVKSALAQARAIVRSSPAESFELLKGVQRNASSDQYSADQVKTLRDEAKRAASQQTSLLNQRLATLKNQLVNQKRLLKTDRSKKEVYEAFIKDTESQIDHVEDSIKTLRRVR